MGSTPSGDGGGSGWFGDDEPWLVGDLDEAFVNAAPVVEKSAAERIAEVRQAAITRRLLDELADEDADLRRHRAARRRRWRLRIVAAVVLFSLFAGAGLRYGGTGGFADTPTLALGDVEPITRWDDTDLPPPPARPSSTPLGRPAATPVEAGRFEFVSTQEDGLRPVAYDPCRPIHYVVNDRTAPAGADALLETAISEITRRTGLQFIDDGPTDETPAADRDAFQPDRYGPTWAPVLIAWTDDAEVAALDGAVVGSAGSVQLQRSSAVAGGPRDVAARLFVTGTVSLDGPELGDVIDAERNGDDLVRAVVLHELGHLVGLDHVPDRGELMFPAAGLRTDFGPGDRHGLAQLGRGACFPDV